MNVGVYFISRDRSLCARPSKLIRVGRVYGMKRPPEFAAMPQGAHAGEDLFNVVLSEIGSMFGIGPGVAVFDIRIQSGFLPLALGTTAVTTAG